MAYDIGPRIGIKGEKEFRNAIRDINAQYRAMNAEMSGLASAFDRNDKSVKNLTGVNKLLNNQIDLQSQKLLASREALEKATSKYGENDRVTQGWKVQVNKATAELNKLDAQLRENNKEIALATLTIPGLGIRIDDLSKGAEEASKKLGDIAKGTMAFSAAATAGATLAAKAAIDYESAFAGVVKTVDGTEKQLQGISDEIRELSKNIPATAVEIARVAEQAGQLGIATEDVTSFTKVMIDLGESTNLSANQAADSLARFANITQMSAENYERLGSTIVDLGNNAATTEAEIVAMSTRLAATGNLVGLTEPQILALATTLSSLGIEAEAGGSAISKLLKEFEIMVATGSPALDDFAKVAKMSASEFVSAWKSDPTKAVAAFVDGLGEINKTGGSAVAVLKELGISEIRMSNAVLAMASSNGLLADNINIANKAWEENTALQTEAEKRYATTESQMRIAKNTLNDIAITMGSEFLPMVNNAIKGVKNLSDWFANLNDSQRDSIAKILTFTATLAPTLMITSKVAKGVSVLSGAYATYKTAVATSATATAALGVAMNMTPIGATATAIGVLASIIGGIFVTNLVTGKESVSQLSDEIEELNKNYESSIETAKNDASAKLDNLATIERMLPVFNELNNQTSRTSEEQVTLSAYAERLNELFGEQVFKLDETTNSYTNAVGSMEEYLDKMRTQIELKQIMAEMEAEIAIQRASEDAIKTIAEQIILTKEKLSLLEEEKVALESDAAAWLENAEARTDNARETHLLAKELEELEKEMGEVNSALQESEKRYSEHEKEVISNADAVESNTEEIRGAAKEQENLIKQSSELAKITSALTNEAKLCSDAFKEQSDSGSISYDTAMKLIDAGYATALAIDAETGSVTLNADEYKRLTEIKIDEQKTTLESQKTSLVDRLNKETGAAIDNSIAFTAVAFAKKGAKEEDTTLLAGMESQIATLEGLRKNLGKVTSATASSAKTTKSSTKAIDKNAEAYKKAREEIEYQRSVELISEEEFYNKLEELQTKYYKESSSEWKKIETEIFKGRKDIQSKAFEEQEERLKKAYEKGYTSLKEYITDTGKARDTHLKENSKAWEGSIKTMFDNISKVESEKLQETIDEYKNFKDEVEKLQKEMENKLSDYGDLMDDEGNLASINDQIKAIEDYGKSLDKLKAKGISDSLLSEITSIGNIDDAMSYMDKLLLKSNTEFEKYNKEWEEKQKLAKETAEKFYKEQADTLDEKFSNELISQLGEITSDTYDIGQDAIKEMAEGMLSGQSDVEDAMYRIINAAIAAAEQAAGIASPSKEFAKLGNFSVDGYIQPWEQRMSEVEDSVRNTIDAGIGSGQSTLRDGSTSKASSTTINDGGVNLYIANVNNSSDRNIQDVMRAAEFYKQQKNLARGVATT